MVDELPDQLLDVQAICDQRNRYRDLLVTATILIEKAPIHSFGQRYDIWRKAVSEWRSEVERP